MKAFLITEASKNKGFDRITRSKAISEEFNKLQIDYQIIINSDDNTLDILNGLNYLQFDWRLFSDRLFEIINNSDIVVFDAENADQQFINSLIKSTKTPVFIDNANDLKIANGIIVDPSFSGDIQNRLYSQQYPIVRHHFSENQKEIIKQRPENILIYSGEQDKSNIIPGVLKILVENLPDNNKEIVVGHGFENTDDIWSLADDKTRVWLKPKDNELSILLKNADFAIASATQPMLELASNATPAIIIAEDDEQFLRKKEIEEYFVFAGFQMDEFFEHNVIEALQKIYSYDRRQEIHTKLKNNFEGNGTKRLIEYIINNN